MHDNTQRAAKTDCGVRAENLGKSFGSLKALDNVSLDMPPGGFHALLGENGAGKSTLVKCIMGYHRPDSGEIFVDGKRQEIVNPREAHALGIGMVYQHFTLVPKMTVAENLTICRSGVPQILDWRIERERIDAFMKTMPFRIDIDQMVTSLSAGEKQKVEILKQLFLGCKYLILDEPTSVLTPGEADELLDLLSGMTKTNALSVLLITHKMREVVGYARDVTVLRHGRVTGAGKLADIEPARLTEMMVGTGAIAQAASRTRSSGTETRLRVENLCAINDRGHSACDQLTFEVRAGEILGVAGVSGNGQKELVEVLAGQRAATAGQVFMHNEPYQARRKEMRRHRVFCLPEEPLHNGCVGKMSVAENLSFRTFDLPPIARSGFVRRRPMMASANELIASYRINASSPDAPAETLSGGNVQRMILARELPADAQVLIVANPCFGLDVRAIAEIRAQIMAARNRGAAILLISEDLDELFELSDRLMVFFAGKIVATMPAPDADRAEVGRHMAGH